MRSVVAIMGILVLGTACSTTTSTLKPRAGGESHFVAPRSYAVPKGELIAAVETTVKQLGWTVEAIDPDAGTVVARTPTSIWTWGDTVMIDTHPQGAGGIRVDLVSTTAQKIDWGKNKANIEKFYAALDANVKSL